MTLDDYDIIINEGWNYYEKEYVFHVPIQNSADLPEKSSYRIR